jgi:hypothetical protein
MTTSLEISRPQGSFHPSFQSRPILGTLHASTLSISSGLFKNKKNLLLKFHYIKKWLKNEVIFEDFNWQKWDKKIVEIARFLNFFGFQYVAKKNRGMIKDVCFISSL